MRKFHFVLATLLLVAISFSTHAEDKLIKSNFNVKKNINFFSVAGGGGILLNENNSFADFQVFDFGDEGTTVLLKYRLETVEKDENGEPIRQDGALSWSGKWIALGYSINANEEGYMVMYGNNSCGQNALIRTKQDGKMIWGLILTESPEGANCVSENLQGIDVDALRAKIMEGNIPGTLSGGKQKGEYMVYELLSLGSRKRYKLNGDYYYEANANTPYIRFYFKNGKLEKWLFL